MALRGPQLLKDFLADEYSNSCSSSGFRSFPRKSSADSSTVRNLLDFELNLYTDKIRKTKSPAKLTRNISAIHRASDMFFNAVKHFPFNTVKSPSVLPRSISRRLSRSRRSLPERRRNEEGDVLKVSVTVRVKDILRWRSFRDVIVDEKPPLAPLDFSTTTGSSTSSSSSSSPRTGSSTNFSSWCDGDFTAEDLPSSLRGDYDVDVDVYLAAKVGKICLPGEGAVGGNSTVDPKRAQLSSGEKEQHSPVSVLNFPFQEEESFLSNFHESPAINTGESSCDDQYHHPSPSKEFSVSEEDRCIEEEEDSTSETGGKARQLLNHVKLAAAAAAATSSAETCELLAAGSVDMLLLDFFSHEYSSATSSSSTQYRNEDELENEMLRVAKAWVRGNHEESFEWEVEGKREAFVRAMESGTGWSKFKEEQQELAIELEVQVLDFLVDELFS